MQQLLSKKLITITIFLLSVCVFSVTACDRARSRKLTAEDVKTWSARYFSLADAGKTRFVCTIQPVRKEKTTQYLLQRQYKITLGFDSKHKTTGVANIPPLVKVNDAILNQELQELQNYEEFFVNSATNLLTNFYFASPISLVELKEGSKVKENTTYLEFNPNHYEREKLLYKKDGSEIEYYNILTPDKPIIISFTDWDGKKLLNRWEQMGMKNSKTPLVLSVAFEKNQGTPLPSKILVSDGKINENFPTEFLFKNCSAK